MASGRRHNNQEQEELALALTVSAAEAKSKNGASEVKQITDDEIRANAHSYYDLAAYEIEGQVALNQPQEQKDQLPEWKADKYKAELYRAFIHYSEQFFQAYEFNKEARIEAEQLEFKASAQAKAACKGILEILLNKTIWRPPGSYQAVGVRVLAVILPLLVGFLKSQISCKYLAHVIRAASMGGEVVLEDLTIARVLLENKFENKELISRLIENGYLPEIMLKNFYGEAGVNPGDLALAQRILNNRSDKNHKNLVSALIEYNYLPKILLHGMGDDSPLFQDFQLAQHILYNTADLTTNHPKLVAALIREGKLATTILTALNEQERIHSYKINLVCEILRDHENNSPLISELEKLASSDSRLAKQITASPDRQLETNKQYAARIEKLLWLPKEERQKAADINANEEKSELILTEEQKAEAIRKKRLALVSGPPKKPTEAPASLAGQKALEPAPQEKQAHQLPEEPQQRIADINERINLLRRNIAALKWTIKAQQQAKKPSEKEEKELQARQLELQEAETEIENQKRLEENRQQEEQKQQEGEKLNKKKSIREREHKQPQEEKQRAEQLKEVHSELARVHAMKLEKIKQDLKKILLDYQKVWFKSKDRKELVKKLIEEVKETKYFDEISESLNSARKQAQKDDRDANAKWYRFCFFKRNCFSARFEAALDKADQLLANKNKRVSP